MNGLLICIALQAICHAMLAMQLRKTRKELVNLAKHHATVGVCVLNQIELIQELHDRVEEIERGHLDV